MSKKTEAKPLTQWQKFFEKDYIGSHSFEIGEEKKVTISKAMEKLVKKPGGKSDLCIVVEFAQVEGQPVIKPMVVGNVSNAKAIQTLSGSKYIENWPGTRLTLYVDANVTFGKKKTGGIRIRLEADVKPQKDPLHKEHAAWGKCVTAMAVNNYGIEAIRGKYNVSESVAVELELAVDEAKLKQ